MGSTGHVGSGWELEMINLQSLISQRQTALALTTAIVNAQNERFHLEYGMNSTGSRLRAPGGGLSRGLPDILL